MFIYYHSIPLSAMVGNDSFHPIYLVILPVSSGFFGDYRIFQLSSSTSKQEP